MHLVGGLILIAVAVFGIRKNILAMKRKIKEGPDKAFVHMLDGFFFGTSGIYLLLAAVGVLFLLNKFSAHSN